ncbi:MAG: TRAP transporter small permease [Synergistaceae bacterium]|nr:TRAP transporter small permease [Synergistaceae bacterium]
MKQFKKTLDMIHELTQYVLFALLSAMVVIVFAQVIFRFVLHASLPWSEEAARYIMVWISMLGASIGLRSRGHIGVEALVMIFPASIRRFISVIATIVAGIFFAGVVFYGFKILKVVAAQESPAMESSMAIPYSSIMVGAVLMLLYSIEELARLVSDGEGRLVQ